MLEIIARFMRLNYKKNVKGKFTKDHKFIHGANVFKDMLHLLMKKGKMTFGVICVMFIVSTLLLIFCDIWLGVWAVNSGGLSEKEKLN